MSERSESPANMPIQGDGGSATQLSILLDAAMAIIDEEFKRSERLDAKSRNMITVAGAFFAVVQAVVATLVNETLGETATQSASSLVLWLMVAAGVATIGLGIAFAWSYEAWRLRDDEALGVKTIQDYREAAYAGNPAVGAKLVDAYARIAEDRRRVNAERADAVHKAAIACGLAMLLIGTELVLAFVAVAVR
ncbi:MAG: hypothetical protein GX537_10495 [Actinobacteria bacterium]|nr:hypothetical protein [Actinomycetota bacterium]